MAQTVLLNMCMITHPYTGRVLVQDKRNSRWSGLTFPGGHVKPGESFSQSVRREVLEETGLSISGETLCGVVHWCHEETGDRRVILLYRAGRFEGDLIKESEEGQVLWMELEEMTRNPRLSDGILDFLKVFLQQENNEAFSLCRNGNGKGFELL